MRFELHHSSSQVTKSNYILKPTSSLAPITEIQDTFTGPTSGTRQCPENHQLITNANYNYIIINIEPGLRMGGGQG